MTVIFLAYATRNGSTRQVTDVIAATLRATGAEVRQQAARSVRAALDVARLAEKAAHRGTAPHGGGASEVRGGG